MTVYRLKGTAGSVINRSFPLHRCLLIGTGDGCDIRLEQPGVAARHAEVRVSEKGSVVLRSLEESSPILCNGEPVTERELASGDEIRVGQCRFLLQAPGLRPERVLTPEAARKRRRHWPWLLLLALLAAALLAWERGWPGVW